MHILTQLFRFYIQSSIHVALAVVSLSVITMIIHGLDVDYALLSFIFFSTIVGYNFVKYFPRSKIYHRTLSQPSKATQIFSIAISFALLVNCFYISIEILAISFCLGLLNMFYAVPMPYKTLREIPFLKVIIIAIIWTVVSGYYPFLENKFSSGYDFKFYFEIFERFTWVIVLMVPFEIRDYKFDKNSLKTMATALGIVKLKVAGMLVISIIVVCRVWVDSIEFNAFYVIVYFSFFLSIIGSKENQNTYYASFWVEALPMIWLVALVTTKL